MFPGGGERGLRLGRIVEGDQTESNTEIERDGAASRLDTQRAAVVRTRGGAGDGD